MDTSLIASRRKKAEVMGGAHAIAADRYQRRNRLIAIPTIVLSVILGTTTLSSFVDVGKAKIYIDILLCILAITLALLTGLQNFLEYSVLAQRHADAAAGLFSLARKWELLSTQHAAIRAVESKRVVESLDETLAEIIRKAPRVSAEMQRESLKNYEQACSAALTSRIDEANIMGDNGPYMIEI